MSTGAQHCDAVPFDEWVEVLPAGDDEFGGALELLDEDSDEASMACYCGQVWSAEYEVRVVIVVTKKSAGNVWIHCEPGTVLHVTGEAERIGPFYASGIRHLGWVPQTVVLRDPVVRCAEAEPVQGNF